MSDNARALALDIIRMALELAALAAMCAGIAGLALIFV